MSNPFTLPSIAVTRANLNIPIQAATSLRMKNGWIKIFNETPYEAVANINSDSVAIPPQSIGGMPLSDSTQILYITVNSVLTQKNPPSAFIGLEVRPDEDMPTNLPIPLPRQVGIGTPLGTMEYSVSYTLFPGAGNEVIFTWIANPVNSTAIATFYQIETVCIAEATNPVFGFFNNVLGFYPIIGTIQNRFIGGPASQMISEAIKNFAPGNPTFDGVLEQAISGGNEDAFVYYPGRVILPPGNTIGIATLIVNATSEVENTYRWTEELT